jgi:hypothetical protein
MKLKLLLLIKFFLCKRQLRNYFISKNNYLINLKFLNNFKSIKINYFKIIIYLKI